MEAGFHPITLQSVQECDETHSLVMGHERPNDSALMFLRQSLIRVVNRLVEAITAERTFFLQPVQISHRHRWINSGRKHRCVWRHNYILNQSKFQAQAWNSEWTVLIVELQITDVVSSF